MSRRRSIHPRMHKDESWIVLSMHARVLLLALGTFSDYADRFRLDLTAFHKHAPGLWSDEVFGELVAGGLVSMSDGIGTILFAFGFRRRRVSKWEALRSLVFERDGFRCQYCGSESNLHCDHVIPQSRGGSDDISNLTTACGRAAT